MSSRSNRRDRAPIAPESLKAQLLAERAAGNTRYGGDAERILAEYLRDRGHSVDWVHGTGIDLSVDGQVNVDVKSHLALRTQSVVRVPKVAPKHRALGVLYPCVVFLDDVIRIYDCPLSGESHDVAEISWEQACEYLARTKRSLRPTPVDPEGVRSAQRTACHQLAQWIAANWGLRAHVVFRGNPLAQAGMAQQGWGPESFYQDVSKMSAKCDLVVLVYFAAKEPRTVFAYPLSRSAEIAWIPKPVGPNRSGRKSFDPKTLDPKFVFAGLAQFEREFPDRFLW